MLGYNPVHNLLAPTGLLTTLPPHDVAVLTGKEFFPTLISGPFHHGLMIVFTAAAIMSVTGPIVSLLRGKPAPADLTQVELAPGADHRAGRGVVFGWAGREALAQESVIEPVPQYNQPRAK